jgi:hypothetical protein
MRKTLAAVLLAAGFQACAAPSPPEPGRAAEPEIVRHPWSGFGLGSWTLVTGRSIAHPDAEPWGQWRDEVVRVDQGRPPILESSWKSRSSETFRPQSEPFFFVPRESVLQGMAERSRQRETIVVAGRSLPCSVVEYAPADPDPRTEIRLTLWRADGVAVPPWDIVGTKGRKALPADVVRATMTLRSRTTVTEVTTEVEDFHASIEVMGRALDCVVGRMGSTTVTEGTTPVLRSWKIWLSPEIPGGIVRRDRQCTGAPGARLYDYTTREEVTAFHAVR